MKQKKLLKIFIILGGIFLLMGFGVYHFFFSMNSLPEGEYVRESTSPKGTYTVKLYETSPALSAGGLRGEVICNETGKKKNIYWEYNRYLFEAGIAEYEIVWENGETVIINGKKLNVKKDTYDFRRKGRFICQKTKSPLA